MSQNRNKLMDLFIGNLSNCVVHEILERAIDEENLREHYNKEFLTSFDIAKRYREKINPKNNKLPLKDLDIIKKKVVQKVNSELRLRIARGYENIDLDDIESVVERLLNKF